MTLSDKIIKWVDENKSWFKVSHLAEICKVDRGNFTRYMQTEIPEKHLPTIMEFIMPLGFTLGEVIKENNKPENKARIEAARNTPHNIGKQFSQPLTESEMINPDTMERIAKLEEKLKMPAKYLPKFQRTQIENELAKLKQANS